MDEWRRNLRITVQLCPMRNLAITAFVFIVGLGLACSKQVDVPYVPKPVATKTVAFQLQLSRNYNDPQFDSLFATVRLAITAVDRATSTDRLVWDTVYTMRPMRAYGNVFPATIRKQFSVTDAETLLRAGYSVAEERRNGFFTNPSAHSRSEPVDTGNIVKTLSINL